MKNLGQMMKQAQEMQNRMAEMRERLDAQEVSGASGGGVVQVTLNGKGEMRRIALDPTLFQPLDQEVLEDLILAAHNDARRKLDAHLAEEMAKVTGGLELPSGFKLPF